MVDKITLTSVASIDNSLISAINSNNALITTAIDNTLSRDGTSPNQMGSNLDMNNNQILNLPPPATINSPARLVDVTSPATIASVPPVGTSGAVVPLLNGNNTFSGTDTFSKGLKWGPTVGGGIATLASGELYFDNFNGFGENNAPFNIVYDLGASAPSGVIPSMFVLNESQGNNTTFVGSSGMFVQTMDRPSVNSSNKGVLYGIAIAISPSIDRNNSPFDDAAGIAISNVGTGRGTEALYFGHNTGIVNGEWGNVIGIDTNKVINGIYFAGTYTGYALTFAHGTNATLSSGVFLIPPTGTIPIVTVGTNFAGVSGNTDAIAVDSNAQTIIKGQGAFFQFGNNPRYVYTQSNVGGVFSNINQGLAFGGNFSSSSSEIDFINTNTAATDSFRFYQQTGASASTLLLDIGTTGLMQVGSGSMSANGSVATAMSSLGPVGSHTTIQEWFTIKNSSGVTRWIPAF